MAPDEGQVFVCDGSDAWDDAQALTAFLERRGLRVWLGWRDKGEILHPTDYFDARAEAARRCGAFVLLLSAEPADVRDLRDLTGLAFSLGKPIFPVLVSERAPLTEFAEVMGDRPWTSTYGPDAPVRMEMLADVLEDLLADGRPTDEPDAAPVAAAASPAAAEFDQPPVAPADAAPGPAAAAPLATAAAAAGEADQMEAAPVTGHAGADHVATGPEPEDYVDGYPAEAGEEEQMRLLRAYVGPRADSYLSRWDAMTERDSRLSWNWPAFLVPPLWLALRKRRVAAVVVGLASLVLLAIGLFLPDWGLLAIPAALGLALWIGILANGAYLRRGERAIAKVRARTLGPHATLAWLQAKGGRDFALPLLVALVLAGGAIVMLAYAFPERRICVGEPCFETGVVAAPVRRAVAPVERAVAPSLARLLGRPAPAATTAAAPVYVDDGVSRDWIQGRWGVVGTNCGIWIAFNPDGTLVDNLGGTGRWLLDSGDQGAGGGNTATLILFADRTGQSMPTEVERQGDSMIFGGQRTAWTREGC